MTSAQTAGINFFPTQILTWGVYPYLCKLLFVSSLSLSFATGVFAHDQKDHSAHNINADYAVSSQWADLANGKHKIGKAHGEIAISAQGNFYLSLMTDSKQRGGIHVYSPQGTFIKEVPGAPDDFHSFVINTDKSGEEYIYGASLKNRQIVKMSLDGKRILELDATSLIPKQYQKLDPSNKKAPPLMLSGIAVDESENIYVVDGYSLDYIHQFNAKGKYITTFGGQQAPYKFDNCHKISIDPRFSPNRLLCTDRKNGRLVHMTLDGELIGDLVVNLRRPSAVAFYKDLLAVAEISGRLSLFDKTGSLVKTLGTNEVLEEINTNLVAPDKWRKGVLTAPHGITFDKHGNLFITEWNKWGRIVRFDVQE